MKTLLPFLPAVFALSAMAEAPLATRAALSPLLEQRVRGTIEKVTGLTSSFGIERVERVPLSGLDIPFLSAQIENKLGLRATLIPGKIG